MEINIEEYYRLYSPMVLRRCRFLLKDEELALDAMQEVFIKLIEKKNRLRGDYPSSLLYRIATNHCLNLLSSRKRLVGDSENLLLSIACSEDGVEDQVVVRDLIDRIFRREARSTREMAVMHYVDEMTLEEVAQESQMSVSGVRKRLRNLKLNAGKMMEEEL